MDIERRLKRVEWTNHLSLVLLIIAVIALWHNSSNDVNAANHPGDIVANSIETRSLAVVNPTGKQGVTIAVGDDGMVSIGMTDVNGKGTISLLADPDGKPSICLAYRNVCRVVIGDVYRGNQREFSVQLRDKAGNAVWMPEAGNPVKYSAQASLNR